MIAVPIKPFPEYKWRWLSVQPSESLLKAPIYLGVLRALKRHEGEKFSSQDLFEDLRVVENELGQILGNTTLARDPNRNLFRNSGQYWKGTGVLAAERGHIQLTEFGRRVAAGEVSQDQFASWVVKNTSLPDTSTYDLRTTQSWQAANLEIKPFELILQAMAVLGSVYGPENAFLRPNELIKIVIPLAGARRGLDEIATAIWLFRNNELDISLWPDCAPDANDKRMAKEFLLFLGNFDICQVDSMEDERFFLPFVPNKIFDEGNMANEEMGLNDSLQDSVNTEVMALIERKRILASITYRAGQPRFRKDVIQESEGKCIITGEHVTDVLEAAHIIPVAYGGGDHINNGICLRMDIHRLYDAGKIRILPNGQIWKAESLFSSPSYSTLRQIVDITSLPSKRPSLEWRHRYL